MTLDPIDAAFVRRLAVHAPSVAGGAARAPATGRRCAAPVPVRTVTPPRPQAVTPRSTAAAVPAAEPERAAPTGGAAALPEPTGDDPIVARLLAQAPQEWAALAAHVESARQRGRRVIAVAGGRAREGRSTLVQCLRSVLRSRGRDVACAVPHDLAVVASGIDGRGATHDKRIILVDAGIWFPPGPIRRPLLQVVSLGCEAAILVRRADTAGGQARQAALEALGIEVLGEVLTFTAPCPAETLDGGRAA